MHTVAKLFLAILATSCLCGLARAQSWNAVESQKALRLAWASYCPPAKVASWSCYWCTYSGTPGLKVVGTASDSGTSTFGYVGYQDQTIYAVFRGTTNLKNVLVDVDFGKDQVWSDQPKAKVHGGFGKAWKGLGAVMKRLISDAKSRCSSCNRVVFVGHSLGGAIATIGSTDFARSPLGLSVQSITLGSPRVGNEAFAEYSTRMVPNTIRWTHSNDPVPHLPLHWMGFDHRPREVWQTSTSNYKLCSQTNGEDSNCANSVSGFSLDALDKHSNYGGLALHSGSCDTFAKRSDLTDEELYQLIHAANTDLSWVRHDTETAQTSS